MLILGLFIGATMVLLFNRYQTSKQTKYLELKEDFILSNGGILKKGTLLKSEKAMNEGFTRYILYINYKSDVAVELKSYKVENLVKPYWMYRDSLAIENQSEK
jgi:hypothetical protein